MRIGLKAAAIAGAMLLAPAHAGAETVPASEQTRDPLPAGANRARITMVTADLSGTIGTWTGIRSCGDAARVRSALQGALDRWLRDQIMANQGRLLLSYGWRESSWSFENVVHPVLHTRSCRGSFTSAQVYARFY